MSYSICALRPAPVVGSPAFADDGLWWLLLLAITLFDIYLFYEIVQLRQQWVREDACTRTAGRATSAAACKRATSNARLTQQHRSVSDYSSCPTGL